MRASWNFHIFEKHPKNTVSRPKSGELSIKRYAQDTKKHPILEPTIAFSEFDSYQRYQQSFHTSELGHLYPAFLGFYKILLLSDKK